MFCAELPAPYVNKLTSPRWLRKLSDMAFDNTSEIHEGIRDRLLALLDRPDRSVNWLAHQIGVTQSTLATQIYRTRFSVDTLAPIARVLGVSLDWLITGRGEPWSREALGTREVQERVLEDLLLAVRTADGHAAAAIAAATEITAGKRFQPGEAAGALPPQNGTPQRPASRARNSSAGASGGHRD